MSGQYVGSELELFAHAKNWKAYWSGLLAGFLGRRVLDVGAGLGATAMVFANREFDRYLALEPDAGLAASMQSEGARAMLPRTFEVRCGTSESLLPADCFDTILYVDVLEHIADDRGELARVAAHLRPGGSIIVLAPAHQWLFTPFDQSVGHVRRYNKRTLLAAVPDGFRVQRLSYVDSVGMAASLGNRLVLRSAMPTRAQIALWDGWMVPVSARIDRLFGYSLGKSIIGVFRKTGAEA